VETCRFGGPILVLNVNENARNNQPRSTLLSPLRYEGNHSIGLIGPEWQFGPTSNSFEERRCLAGPEAEAFASFAAFDLRQPH
jgi:hypothetical protein